MNFRSSQSRSVLALLTLLAVLSSPRIGEGTEVGEAWQEVTIDAAGDNPFPRGSFDVATVGNAGTTGWMFGGGFDDFVLGNTFFDDLYQIDVTGSGNGISFTQVQPAGPTPSARAFPALAAASSGSNTYLLLFGGGTFTSFSLTPSADKFWIYDVGGNSWTDLSHLGGPEPRSGCTAVVHKNDFYVFGGVSFAFAPPFFITSDELWKFNLDNQEWTLLSTGAGPAPKHVAMGATVDDEQLLIFGGERAELGPFGLDFPIDQETWEWDLDDGGWTQRDDGPLQNYSAFGDGGDNAILFGGDASGGSDACGAPFAQNPTNDLLAFDPDVGWIELAPASAPPPAKRVSGLVLNHRFYTFGGFDFVCEDESDPGQIWNTQVFRIDFDD